MILGFNSVSASDSSDLIGDSATDLGLNSNGYTDFVSDSDSDEVLESGSDVIDDELLDSGSDFIDDELLDSGFNSNEIEESYNSDSLKEDIESIYVSKDGSDDNDGSESTPVASISKAVNLAKDKSTSIIIREGTYNENNITINTSKAISFEGEGNVVIDGTGLARNSIFTILGNSVVSIKNIGFSNNKGANGGAIRINDDSRNMIFVNIIIEDCTFDNLNSSKNGGAISADYLIGTFIIRNSKFTNNNASTWGGALYIGYSAYPNSLSVRIIDSSFDSNYANNGGGVYMMARNINITGTNITHNEAKNYPGALYMQNCTASLDNCIISNNTALKNRAAISILGASVSYIPPIVNPANASIVNCIIENNTVKEGTGAAIYLENANLNMSYSSVSNDFNLNNSVTANYNDDQPGLVIINNNWWGTNNPSSTVVGNNTVMDNWIIMNLEANATYVQAGDSVRITADFNHVNTTSGVIGELTGGTIPKTFTVLLSGENGTLEPAILEIPKGGIGEATFTANAPTAKITANCDDVIREIIYTGEVPEPYSGIVYLSKEANANDNNRGSEDAPVASLAKAIAIATAETGSGQIIIKEGTYTGTDYRITNDLSITGIGNVIIDGEGQGRLFYMDYGDEANGFSLSNLTLTGANYGYGAAVYSFAKKTVLDNVKIVNNPGAGDLITTYGETIIKDSLISGHDGGDVIEATLNGNFIINNTIFENNIVNEYAIAYVSGGSGDLIIENSQFINNSARLGIVKGNTGTNIDVKGSKFIDNTVTVGFGGAISVTDKLDLTESIFINNKANRDGGAIHIGTNGEANIAKCLFVNNSAGDGSYGDAIYNNNKATVNYCIFFTNSTHYLIFNNNQGNIVNAQYNWWGTNDNPSSFVAGTSKYDEYDDEYIECPVPDVSNWILMNIMVDTSNAKVDREMPIAVDFNHYFDNSTNDIRELEGKLAQELIVDFSSITGALDKFTVETTDLVAIAKYIPVEGFNNITVKSSNAEISIPFTAYIAVPTDLTAEKEITIEFGSGSLNVSLSSEGSPLEGKLISVKINDEITLTGTTNAQGIAVIDLGTVPIGTYNAEVRFDGEAQYDISSTLCKIIVKETPKSSEDLQRLIDETPAGGLLNLSNMEFVNVSGINITKDIAIVGNNITINTAGDGNPIFNIPSNVGNVSISGIDFVANSGDVIVKAAAANGTDDLSIVNPAIEITNNTVRKANDDVVAESITLFKLESERALLATSNEININGNALADGVKTFDFEISGLNNGSDVVIPQGGNINGNGSSYKPIVKVPTAIASKNIKTTTVNTKINGKKAGKTFSITLKDNKGNVLANKQVLISFNGKIYKRTTNKKGVATVKVALAKKGTYPVVISFLGDDKYKGSFAVAKVKVNPQKVKLTVAKKKYKASKKKKVLTAKLLASNKKAIKGKKLVFIVNKKKYTAKTNKKGIAKVKVKLSRKKTYKIKVKFAGDSTFKKATKKGKVIIK